MMMMLMMTTIVHFDDDDGDGDGRSHVRDNAHHSICSFSEHRAGTTTDHTSASSMILTRCCDENLYGTAAMTVRPLTIVSCARDVSHTFGDDGANCFK